MKYLKLFEENNRIIQQPLFLKGDRLYVSDDFAKFITEYGKFKSNTSENWKKTYQQNNKDFFNGIRAPYKGTYGMMNPYKRRFANTNITTKYDKYGKPGSAVGGIYAMNINITSSPDELMPEFVKNDNLEMLKKMINKAFFDYEYTYWDNRYQRKSWTLFQIAKDKNNSVLEFFKSEKFQRWYLKDLGIEDQTNNYRQLVDDEIVNPKIVDEYEYLIGGEKYNL